MSERTRHAPGTPCWVDLIAKDLAAAKTFYGGLFGWTFEDQAPEGEVVYVQWYSKGKNVAGMGPMSPEMLGAGMPQVWTTYIATDDVDVTSAKVQAAGGTVTIPVMQIFDAGPHGDVCGVALDGAPVGGMMRMPPAVPAEVPPYWLTYFAVEDADAAVAELERLGGTVLNPAVDIPPGRFAVVSDPGGAAFCVMALAAPV